MAENTKTPLQAVVGVICDCLCDLPPEDQVRALEAARVTLGLRAPTSVQDRNPFQETRRQDAGAGTAVGGGRAQLVIFQESRLQRPLPTVEVQMMGDRPVVMNPPTDMPSTDPTRQAFVVAGPRRVTVLQPQAPQPPVARDPVAARLPARGFVRSIR